MIAVALYAKLSGTTAVTDLISTRVYPDVAPEGAIYPFVTFQQVSDGNLDARPLVGAATYFRTLQQIDIYARLRSEADAVANAIRGALDGATGQTWGGVAIKAALFDQQIDADFEEDANIRRVIQQYRVVFQES